jgi:hypothetical protein
MSGYLKNTKDPPKTHNLHRKKTIKQEPPFLGHKMNSHGGEFPKHPPKTHILVL